MFLLCAHGSEDTFSLVTAHLYQSSRWLYLDCCHLAKIYVTHPYDIVYFMSTKLTFFFISLISAVNIDCGCLLKPPH